VAFSFHAYGDNMIDTIRHEHVIPASKRLNQIIIIGLGAIGSKIFIELVKTGFKEFVLIDDDNVEPHNIANQAFLNEHIKTSKVDACVDLVSKHGAFCQIDVYKKRVSNTDDLEDIKIKKNAIIIMAVDSLEAREDIAATFANIKFEFLVDVRMSTGHYEIYLLDNENLKDNDTLNTYLSTFPPEDSVEEVSPCGSSLSVGATSGACATNACWMIYQRNNHADMKEHLDFKRTYDLRSGEATRITYKEYCALSNS
jgi:molybdopterin/thiamine biosynthesis adenylyltransferase